MAASDESLADVVEERLDRLRLRHLIDLRPGSDIDAAVQAVRQDVPLQGATVWMLVCSALLASLGLDTSSTAVVIGAMLISPLMTPILGVGMGLAVLDRLLIARSLRVLAVATVASLVASTLYFLVTPLGVATPELLARTRPTLLDVAIAFVGGAAGIVAASRKSPTNAIPGVAIATALMPPLCTAGFGIATGQWTYAIGAFYLFFLNSVFIAAATYGVTLLLHARAQAWQSKQQHDRMVRFVVVALVLTALPAGVLLYDTVRESQVQRRADRFVQTHLRTSGREVLRWTITGEQRLLGESGEQDAVSELRAALVGRTFSPGEQDSLQALMGDAGLGDYTLRLVVLGESSGLSPEEAAALLALRSPSGTISEASGPKVKEIPPPVVLDSAAYAEARLIAPALDSLALVPDSVAASLGVGADTFAVRARFNERATRRDTAALVAFLRAHLDAPVVLRAF